MRAWCAATATWSTSRASIRNAGDALVHLPPGPRRSPPATTRRTCWATSSASSASAKVERFGDDLDRAHRQRTRGDRPRRSAGSRAARAAHQLRAACARQADRRPHHRARPAMRTKPGVGWIVTHRQGRAATASTSARCSRSTVSFPPMPDPRPSKEPDRIVPVPGATVFYQPDRMLDLPDERTGPRCSSFRVFDRVSYALLLRHHRSGRRRRLRPQSLSATAARPSRRDRPPP